MAIVYGRPGTQKPNLPKGSRGYRGNKGEQKVLEKLKELDDSFNILCNVRLGSYLFSQRSTKRTAQIDFVIISRRGIISLEVKNWSDKYYAEHKKYGYPSPHLQAEKIGRKLWTDLHFYPCNMERPPVSKVLLSTYGIFQQDPNFPFVNVKNMNNINNFLQNQTEKLSEDAVNHIVEYLMRFVPYGKYDFRYK